MQQKILNLLLVFILAIVGAFFDASAYLSNNLTKVVDDSAEKQKSSMTKISEETMLGMLNVTFT